MQCSYSRLDTFQKCAYKYKLRYIDQIKTIPPTESDNALVIGQALHTGIQKGVETAIQEYYMSYPVIDDGHINEALKLEYLIPLASAELPPGQYEVEIVNDDFHGFIDLLAPVTMFRGASAPNLYDIYDFKYSNNVSNYEKSAQLHLYKYFFELCNPGKRIRNLYYVFVPKVSIKQKKDEDLTEFRNRLTDELKQCVVRVAPQEYNGTVVTNWLIGVKKLMEATDFKKTPSYLCRFCEYEEFCMKGNDFMNLPKNERRSIERVEKRTMWIYGVPFCGKTTFANAFPDPLMLNSDGNIKFVDAPYIHIKDEVKVEGRMTKKTAAWEIFKNVVEELEKKDNDFKTLVVDLLEDFYEHCRVYMCAQMGISHESDDSFKAWDKVRTEFLNTLKRLVNLDYENIILISHEDTSKDLTKKGGDKVTSIKPNLSDKVAMKVSGMVDVVARIVADGDVRTFNFKSNEVIFGGGRLKVQAKDIPLEVDALFSVYDEANKSAAGSPAPVVVQDKPVTRTAVPKGKETISDEVEHFVSAETLKNAADLITPADPVEPVTRSRSRRSPAPSEDASKGSFEDAAGDIPARTRKRRGE